MNRMFLVGVAAFGALVLVAAGSGSSESSEPAQASPGIATSWPATVPVGPNPPRPPGMPYDVGPASAAWRYEDLSAAERALVDAGRNTSAWDGPNAIYQQAAEQAAEEALARDANQQLGIGGLGPIGVVP